MPSLRPPTPARTAGRAARRRAAGLLAAVTAGAVASACGGRAFNAARFRSAPDLYRASVQRFERRKWDDALQGFDRLANQLPTRDTLLPKVFFYQGQAHARKGEHLLAAQAYARIGDAFPDDSLADDALFQQGREYRRLWPRPSLDPTHGQTALATFRQLVQLYPESPLVPAANREAGALQQQFAQKDLNTALDYVRRKAYDSALIFFRDVVRLYPETPAARTAYLRMIDTYRKLRYQEEVAEVCADMRRTYPSDGDVQRTCGAAPVSVAPTTPPGGAPAGAQAGAPGAGTAPASPAPVPPPATPTTGTPATGTPTPER